MKISLLVKTIFLSVALAISGCATSVDPRAKLASNTPNKLPMPGGENDKPKRCLALSGGGIRAAAVSLGALQELSSENQLENFQIVTSVSGGGYPIYGILYQLLNNPKATPRELLEEKSAFINKIDKGSKFISQTEIYFNAAESIFFAVVQYPIRKAGSLDKVLESSGSFPYGLNIHGTFAERNPLKSFDIIFGGDKLRDFKKENRKGFPYPIFLASLYPHDTAPPEDYDFTHLQKDLFELSPEWLGHLGNGNDGQTYYGYYKNDNFSLLNTIVASGAATDTPKTKENKALIPDPLKKIGVSTGVSVSLDGKKRVFLTDGGFIENQGVLPLVQRECKSIVAIDSSFDPKTEMDGWVRLKTYIDDNTKWKFPDVPYKDKQPVPIAWELPGLVSTVVLTNGENDDTIKIDILKLGLDATLQNEITEAEKSDAFDNSDAFDKDVKKFIIKNSKTFQYSKTFQLGKPPCKGQGKSERCAFPMESTYDQSYTKDEFRAYRQLGKYLVTQWLKNKSDQQIVASTSMQNTE